MESPASRILASLTVAVSLSLSCAPIVSAAPLPADAAGRTVGLFTYYVVDGKLLPAHAFSGVLISPSQIVTSAWALSQGPTDLGAANQRSVLTQVFAVITADGKTVVLPCHALDSAGTTPLTLLEINEQDRAQVQKLAANPIPTGALPSDADARAVGVIGPEDMSSDALSVRTVPAPVAMKLHVGEKMKLQGVAGGSVTQALPPSMAGAGVWDDNNQLVGVLTRFEDAFAVTDPASITKLASFAKPEPVKVADPTTSTPKPPPDKPATPDATVAVSRNLKGLMDMLKQEGLTLQVDQSLLDYVKQDQADLVMAKIAGGKSADAIKMLDDIEPLSSGTLAEQLNYRRALALLMLGKYSDAHAKAQACLNAEDDLVKSRGRALFKVLDEHPDGLIDGKPLSDPKILTDSLNARNDDTLKQLDTMFAAAKNTQLVSKASFDIIEQRLQSILKRVDINRQSRPGYFDDFYGQVVLYHDQLLRREYARANVELVETRQKYLEEMKQAEFKSGPDWSKPGYWPEVRVGRINVLADKYNDLLAHLAAVGDQLDAAERHPLKPDEAKPLDRLALAKRIEHR